MIGSVWPEYLPDNSNADEKSPDQIDLNDYHLCCRPWEVYKSPCPEFREAAFKVLEKFEHKCFCCSDTGELWVHYGDLGTNNIDDDGQSVVLLCKSCHQERHEYLGDFYSDAAEIVDLKAYRDYQANQD